MRDTDVRPARDRRRPGATRGAAAPAGAGGSCARSSRACIIACLVLAAACGPSLRRVHYGDVFFERCAAADASGERATEERRACWAEWLAHYRLGQPPERITWATERMAALAAGDEAPTVPELRAGAVGSGTEAATSAATRGTGPEAEDDPSPPAWDRSPPAPAAERVGVCSAGCDPPWETCTARCDADARDCRRACDAEYQVCVRACP